MKDKYILSSLSNALDILDLLGKNSKLSVPDIAALSGFGKSSVFRILATLESKGFVSKSKDAKYSLDFKLVNLGNFALNNNLLLKYGHRHLENLTVASGETSHMGIMYHNYYCRFIDKVLSDSTIHMDSYPGFYRYAHYLGCGKAMLAHEPSAFLEEYIRFVPFDLFTKNSIKSGDDLLSNLETIKKSGYAVDNEECEYGLYCLAAPIRDNTDKVVAAISISGPKDRMKRNEEKNILLVKKTASDISYNLITALKNQNILKENAGAG